MPVQLIPSDFTAEELGAPAMVQMVPSSLYLDRYVFEVPPISDGDLGRQAVQVVRAVGGADVSLDGVVIADAQWELFGCWSTVTVEVDEGSHVLASADRFGAIAYGYGSSNFGRAGYAHALGLRAEPRPLP